ncbi:site-specific recombinase XerD [Anaerobacterium chartisolvens]|uniref:Site-specific recombinase XerD n=1 Tax=Anaerobacterium chartisolvens TaxID=1297424 RepID=A0A369ARY5_9FIRM|nr:tyrosine-type recombinase/integrase [Anaerobacterium chartisolvens]RCX12112.1 site-specific recombinase XerD [Anaerobacterium chartisolvens]
MKTTDFAVYLNKYFTQYMPNERGNSPQSIDSYRYAFILYLEYMESVRKISAERIVLSDFTRETVTGYLNWLGASRKSSPSTRNQRLAALKGFVHYLKYEFPDYLDEYQRILGIPLKKTLRKEISYMKTDGVNLLVEQIDVARTNGLRDYVILLILYTTGIRVTELINIKVKDISLTQPYTIRIHGKGNKGRYVPLMRTAVPHIKRYLETMGYDNEARYEETLFNNHMKTPFTRQGINYVLKKYGIKAKKINSDLIPDDLSAHKMRHTTAMELVTSGVDLMYIRDLLGHSSVVTTEIYARTDAKLKRKAIEAASKEIVPPEDAQWDNNNDLKTWLKNFNKR